MAERKAKTSAKNAGERRHKHVCPQCGADSKATLFTGFGRKGIFLVCEKACGYLGRVR